MPSESLKITLCARQFKPPMVGGVDVYANRLRQALQRLGHEVSVIAVDSSVDTANGKVNVTSDHFDGTPIWRLEFAFSRRPKEAFDNLYDSKVGTAIEEALRCQKPDLFVILNFYTITLAAVDAAKSQSIPVFHIATDFLPICRRATLIRWNGQPCTTGESIKSCSDCFVSHHFSGRAASSVMNLFPEKMLTGWAANQEAYGRYHPFRVLKPYWREVSTMERRLQILDPLRQQIDLVMTPTTYTRDVFLRNGFAARRAHFLPFGVERDHPLAQVQHVPASNTRFLFIGRLQPYKGAHLLLEAFNNLGTPRGATLTLYGTAGGYEQYFARLKKKMAGNARIQFGGRIGPEELKQAFAESDYFILPSTWHENSPLILLDALQSRTPVIASAVGGVTDLIQDGVNGLLFPMGDVNALQERMQKAIDEPALGEHLRIGVQLPDIDDYARQMLRLFQENQ